VFPTRILRLDFLDWVVEKTFLRMIKIQLVMTIFIGLLIFIFAGFHGAMSVFAGGAAVVIGSYLGARIASRKLHQDAGAILINVLKAEAIKIITIFLVLLLTFKFYIELVPLYLILGLAGAALISGAAIFKIKENKLIDASQAD